MTLPIDDEDHITIIDRERSVKSSRDVVQYLSYLQFETLRGKESRIRKLCALGPSIPRGMYRES
jgi:hypothetical protein